MERHRIFYLCGDDPIRRPAIWPVLELLRDEGVSFSLLSEPEKTEFEQSRHAKQNPCRNQQFCRFDRDILYVS